MKTITVILFLMICGTTQSQIHYLEVSAKYEKANEYREGYFDNVHAYEFSVNNYFLYNYCTISGYVDIPLDNKIIFKTGWDYEYLEAETRISDGYFRVIISTDNLPKLLIGVYYSGSFQKNLRLEDVDISFSGKKI